MDGRITMNNNEILNIFYIIAMVFLGFTTIWYKGNANLKTAVSDLISEAEYLYKDSSKAGGEKFNWVVDQLYNLLPLPLKAIISKQMIGQIVQSSFNAMSLYAKSQLDRLTDGKKE